MQTTRDSLFPANMQPVKRIVAPGALPSPLLTALLCISLPGLWWQNTQQVFEQTYKLPAGGHFLLDNVNGSVQVEGWDRDEVEVSAVKTSQNDSSDVDLVKIDVQTHPGEVDVHTRYPGGKGVDVAVEYHIHVPNRVLLGSVGTVNGSVLVHGVKGKGEGQLRSVNGNVEVTHSSGRFTAKTTNGDVRLELNHHVDGATMNLETVNGSVLVGLPSNGSADLKVHNMNGDVLSDVPGIFDRRALPGARAFQGKLGHGGGEISVRTINGRIRLLLEQPGV